jgi:hypothetical protein
MSLAVKGAQFPNLFLTRPDGTSLELYDLWKKEHCLLLLLKAPNPDALAFIQHFQDQARLFEWLNTRLIVVYTRREAIPSPWPAPGYPACLFGDFLPQGVEWDKAYVISKNRTLMEIYPEPAMLSVAKVEKDMLYWEAGHCLP